MLVRAGTGGPCPRLGAPQFHAPQSYPVPGEGLVSEQSKVPHGCWEVPKQRHKSQAQMLQRRAARKAWCSQTGGS